MSDENQYSLAELDSMDSYATFKAALQGKNQAYFTPAVERENATAMVNWALANGMIFGDGANLGFWQLSFANTKSLLKLDQDAPIIARLKAADDAAFRERVNAMSVTEIKDTFRRDSEFRARYEALS